MHLLPKYWDINHYAWLVPYFLITQVNNLLTMTEFQFCDAKKNHFPFNNSNFGKIIQMYNAL